MESREDAAGLAQKSGIEADGSSLTAIYATYLDDRWEKEFKGLPPERH